MSAKKSSLAEVLSLLPFPASIMQDPVQIYKSVIGVRSYFFPAVLYSAR